MSTELATAEVDSATLEKVVITGDLSKLSAAERLRWYRARCEAAGLDPRAQPFQYLVLNQRLVLYATKAATDQLIANHRLTVEIPDRKLLAEVGIYEVRCRVTFPDGRHVEDLAALSVRGLQAEPLCNAIMKCVTKAKRRTVLSACGLGVLDETEVETIPGAQRFEAPQPPPTPAPGIESASPSVVAEFRQWRDEFIRNINAKWLEHWAPDGHPPPKLGELLNKWQLTNHLLKWAVASDLLAALDTPTPAQAAAAVAGLMPAYGASVMTEARRYAQSLWRTEAARLKAREPEDASQDLDPDADYADEPGMEG